MIDEHSSDGIGWARFSDDRKMRYRLSRQIGANTTPWASKAVFVMLNPSTADAFKVDPTVHKCVRFAQIWGADVLEVVNLFALRSTDPKGLDAHGDYGEIVGADTLNDNAILDACRGAKIVIAAWGNNGWRGQRDANVRDLLHGEGIALHHLGTTQDGYPTHPLARGKAFIPLDRKPVEWLA